MDSASSETNALVRVFITLQLTGCFAFAFMVFSAILFASTVKRHPIWFNFCLSFIVFSLSYSLLAFAPGQQGRDGAPEGVCIAQAAMVYAAPFLAPSASLALVALLLMNIVSALSTSVKKRYPMTLTIALAGPWILWAAVLTGAIIFILRDRSVVALSDNGTYCIVTRSPLPRLAAISSAVFAVGILVSEVIIASLLYRHRAIKDVFSQSISMAIRIFIFTAVAVTAAVAGLIFACTDRRGVIFDVMIAIVPSTTAVIFGTQMDLWEGYMFWRKRSGTDARVRRFSTSVVGTMTVPSSQGTISIRASSSRASHEEDLPSASPTMAVAAVLGKV
ncbi:hypothetical protein BKA70DRAFT_1388432 [Coprinopsis sp. MPI-PUGE-AT-0042]|nr:hypothetical protein BKA70DRAFT_1388432 [Coprinopsis sp. MPI-PUGE-AT-0042]